MELVNTVFTQTYDDIIGGTAVTPLLYNATVVFAAAGTIKKGTLLTLDSVTGKYAATVKAGTADVIMQKDVTMAAAGDVVAGVYVRGIFKRDKLVVADGDTVATHEIELRKVGIYMTAELA